MVRNGNVEQAIQFPIITGVITANQRGRAVTRRSEAVKLRSNRGASPGDLPFPRQEIPMIRPPVPPCSPRLDGRRVFRCAGVG